jgi:hypothetical protein
MNDDTVNLYPVGPGNEGGQRKPPRRPGRPRRIITTSVAGAVLLGGGAAIGVALTGGASASTNSAPVSTVTSELVASASASPGTGGGATNADGSGSRVSRCTRLAEELILGNHLKLAERLHALCTHPVLRLALVGGEYGTVTFRGKSGPTTFAFERGTVESDTGSVITVTTPDGTTTWTWNLTSSTVVRQDGSKATVADGDQVFVAGTAASGAYDARLIRIRGTGQGTASGS